ncbi:uncharacterized protein IUM83_18843 [Phytophthora cinnamomi]|uniref:uncharacterized protein n=1 Tax=Phytophthora cinnamomi TaxID=4785 RepID=UPI00355A517C|nr:hypothetical protein IUM83_18843 [Phytophthora cinnamomi]
MLRAERVPKSVAAQRDEGCRRELANDVADNASVSSQCLPSPRKLQAPEVLNVLEKRCWKTPFAKREPPQFGDYPSARNSVSLGCTSSADTFRELEWYLSSAVEGYKLYATLDKIVGQPFYFEYSTADAYRAH